VLAVCSAKRWNTLTPSKKDAWKQRAKDGTAAADGGTAEEEEEGSDDE